MVEYVDGERYTSWYWECCLDRRESDEGTHFIAIIEERNDYSSGKEKYSPLAQRWITNTDLLHFDLMELTERHVIIIRKRAERRVGD